MKIVFLIFLILNLNFENEIDTIFFEGFKISTEDLKELENKLKEDPDDFLSRIKIIGYYSNLRFKDENAKKGYQKNVLWLIKNKPDLKTSVPLFELNPSIDGEAYTEGKNLWLENLEKFKDDLNVLENAASYFLIYEKEISEKLYKKLQELKPNNPEWYKKLGFLYKLSLKSLKDKEKLEFARKSLQEYEKAYKLEKEEKKFYILRDLAETSFEAGEIERAKNYAKELLDRSKGNEKSFDYGNAVHYGNIILGKIALKEKKIKEAEKHLIAAGNTHGSPQLKSFGPDFSLAEELLKMGEKRVVLDYLNLCEKFWEKGKEKLKDWQILIKNDRIPEFWR